MAFEQRIEKFRKKNPSLVFTVGGSSSDSSDSSSSSESQSDEEEDELVEINEVLDDGLNDDNDL